MWKSAENHRYGLCFHHCKESMPSMALSQPLFADLCALLTNPVLAPSDSSCRTQAATRSSERPTRPAGFYPSPFLGARAMLSLGIERPQGATSHGMGHPSARRDRSELRNQLVRQRRTLTCQTRFRSTRFLKRAICITGVPFLVHRCKCSHAH